MFPFDKTSIGANARRLAKMLHIIEEPGTLATQAGKKQVNTLARDIGRQRSNQGLLTPPEPIRVEHFAQKYDRDLPYQVEEARSMLSRYNPRRMSGGYEAKDFRGRTGKRLNKAVTDANDRFDNAADLFSPLSKIRKQRPALSLGSFFNHFNPARRKLERVSARVQQRSDRLLDRIQEAEEARDAWSQRRYDKLTSIANRKDPAIANANQVSRYLAADKGPLPRHWNVETHAPQVQSLMAGSPNARTKMFSPGSMSRVTPQSPIWYSGRSDVPVGYARFGANRNDKPLLAITDESQLRRFGDVSPLSQHVAADTRGMTEADLKSKFKRFAGRNAEWASKPDYEQVGTMPDFGEWVRSHRFFRPNHQNPAVLQELSPRAFGRQFGGS